MNKPSNEIRFDDGAAYEQMMGRWSALVGERFLGWIAVPAGARWADVGCGNGAFTQQITQHAAPAEVWAFDPSPGQLSYARTRLPPDAPTVHWAEGDAMKLPLADASCDVAVMALVLFFVPEPAVGVAEMVRVVRPGSIVAAYHWDILNGGFPLAAIGAEALKMGLQPPQPPSVEASTIEASAKLWTDAGLRDVRTTQFTVERGFSGFDEYWNVAITGSAMRSLFGSLPAEDVALLKSRVRERVKAGDGPLTLSARANAICGVRA